MAVLPLLTAHRPGVWHVYGTGDGEPGVTAQVYDRLVVTRPSDEWQRRVEEEAAEFVEGSLSPDHAYTSVLWPESLRVSTDTALAVFEEELHALLSPSDAEILSLVQRLVVALNAINDQHVRSGQTGYETTEREELREYIDASLEESGIEVQALEARQGIGPRDGLVGQWRDW